MRSLERQQSRDRLRHSSLPNMTEWDAAEYSRRSSLQEAMAQEVLALLDLNGSERILDVGCGDGKITAEIASRASKGSVVGVDPSRDMISFAQGHFGPATLPNLRFLVGCSKSALPKRIRSCGFFQCSALDSGAADHA